MAFCPACTLVQRNPPPATHPARAKHPLSAEAAASLARQLTTAHRLGPGSFVLEAGSDEGILLRHYRAAGIPVLGIESSHEAARIARQQHGVLTREAIFSRSLADRLFAQGLRCDLFHAHGQLAGASDLTGFVRGIRRVLKDDGLAIIETPYLKAVLDGFAEFGADDQLCYFSLTALCHCLIGHGLCVRDVEETSQAGGSVRIFAVPAHPGVWPFERLVECLAAEEAWGVRAPDTYSRLVRRHAG